MEPTIKGMKINKETKMLLNIAGLPKTPEPLYTLSGEEVKFSDFPTPESLLKKRSVDESKSSDVSKSKSKDNIARIENFRLLWTLPSSVTNIKEVSRELSAYMIKSKKGYNDIWSIACLINGLAYVNKESKDYVKVRETFDILRDARSYLQSDNPSVWLDWHSACVENGVKYVSKSDPMYEKVNASFAEKRGNTSEKK